VVPALVRKCIEAREAGHASVDVWGDGSATREFLYVEDAAEGIVAATERYDGGDPVNLGSGVEMSIRELAAHVARATGYTGEFRWNPSRPNGQPRRWLDVARAEERFGFRARTPFETGLARTVEAFLETRVRA
jgi:GDP-L-fucose synthase